MLVNYAPFADRMIHRYEGGYGWDRADPGGPTKFGITCFDLAAHRGQKMSSMSAWVEPVKNMTLAEAEPIYKTKYATGVHFDELPSGIDTEMFDYGVNSGVSRPVHVARALVGLPAGGMDNALLDALNRVDPNIFIDKMSAERLRFMHAIRGGAAWSQFGHGWNARVVDLQSYSHHIASGHPHTSAPEAPDLSKVVTPKAIHVPKTAGIQTGGGAIGTGVAVHEAGFPYWGTAIAVGGVIAAGIAYEFWQERKAAAANVLVHI